MKISLKLEELDQVDRNIITYLQNEADLTHSTIADNMGYSQPTIGMRINKLKEIGILEKRFGINLNRAGLKIAVVQITSRNPQAIFKIAKKCPFIINCLEVSGKRNIILQVIGRNLKFVHNLIDRIFRDREDASNIQYELISHMSEDIIAQLDFKILDEKYEEKYLELC